MSVKAARYARKVEKRHKIMAVTPGQFLEDASLVEKDIWELGYASTSDEDDNDEDEESSEYDSEEEDEENSGNDSSNEESKKKSAASENFSEPPKPSLETPPAALEE